jgi:iron complex outermembrane recepter protein
VQVLKGPQGTLFGRNTTGGAVLLVPQKPTHELGGYVELSAGGRNMLRAQGVLNLPINDWLRIRVGVDRMGRDGYLTNHSGIGPKKLGDVDFLAARFSVVADLASNLENYTIFAYSNSNNHGIVPRVVGCNNGQFASEGFPGPSPFAPFCNTQLNRQNARGDGWWDVENTEPNPISHQTTWQVINTTTWTASDSLTVKNIFSYGEFREKTRYSLEGDDYTTPSGQLAMTLIRLNNTPDNHNAIQSTLTEELQFQGHAFDNRLNWQAGGYYENSDPIGFTSQATTQLMLCQNSWSQLGAYLENGTPISCPATLSGSISIPFQKTWFRDRGLYAQGTYKITDQLSFTAGIRYTWDKMTHRYDGVSIRFPTPAALFTCGNSVRVTNPDGTAPVILTGLSQHDRCNVTFTAKSDKPTWLIDLDYKPIDNVMIYAKWARGYRAGGVASANVFFETWEPEKVDTYEVGAKTSFHGGSVRGYFNIAGFYNNFQNQQIQATLQRNPRPGNPFIGGSAIMNIGKSRIWGIEIDSSVTFFDLFRLDAGYTYLNTKALEVNVPTIPPPAQQFYIAIIPTTREGQPLSLSPKHRLSLTGTFTIPVDESLGHISIGATYVYTSKQIASLATPTAFGIMPHNHLINLNLEWSNFLKKPVDLSAFVTNLTNEEFPLNVNNAFGSFGLESQIVNEPRMWGLRARFHFGG